jgi:hypothetical protein
LITDIGTQPGRTGAKAAPDAVSFGKGRHTHRRFSASQVRDQVPFLPIHESVLASESHIFFDKTGSEMTSGI